MRGDAQRRLTIVQGQSACKQFSDITSWDLPFMYWVWGGVPWMALNARHYAVKWCFTTAAIVQPLPSARKSPEMSTPAKARPATAPMVFTANRLCDGRVVWLAAGGAWAETLAEAQVFPPERVAAGLALAQQGERAQQVVGTYGVEIALQGGQPVPVKFREQLRVRGPSVKTEPPAYRLAS